jgi:hypothetical protein
MNDEQRRLISQLMDGECSEAELSRAIDCLLADVQLQQTWKRYLLIGQGIRQETIRYDIRSQADPSHKSPLFDPRSSLKHRGISRWRIGLTVPLGVALAAGLALIALVLLPEKSVVKVAPIATTAPDSATREPEQRWQRDSPLPRAKLDQLIVDHQERAGGPGITGVASYVPVIGYEGQP